MLCALRARDVDSNVILDVFTEDEYGVQEAGHHDYEFIRLKPDTTSLISG